jgi:hypothetical protein
MALSLARYTKDQVKLQRKSEDTVNSDRVLRFLYDRETGHIEANVQASMKNTSYRVQVYNLLCNCMHFNSSYFSQDNLVANNRQIYIFCHH